MLHNVCFFVSVSLFITVHIFVVKLALSLCLFLSIHIERVFTTDYGTSYMMETQPIAWLSSRPLRTMGYQAQTTEANFPGCVEYT